jgi:hypothetical protein
VEVTVTNTLPYYGYGMDYNCKKFYSSVSDPSFSSEEMLPNLFPTFNYFHDETKKVIKIKRNPIR